MNMATTYTITLRIVRPSTPQEQFEVRRLVEKAAKRLYKAASKVAGDKVEVTG